GGRERSGGGRACSPSVRRTTRHAPPSTSFRASRARCRPGCPRNRACRPAPVAASRSLPCPPTHQVFRLALLDDLVALVHDVSLHSDQAPSRFVRFLFRGDPGTGVQGVSDLDRTSELPLEADESLVVHIA